MVLQVKEELMEWAQKQHRRFRRGRFDDPTCSEGNERWKSMCLHMLCVCEREILNIASRFWREKKNLN
jgi:hypothetical protein